MRKEMLKDGDVQGMETGREDEETERRERRGPERL